MKELGLTLKIIHLNDGVLGNEAIYGTPRQPALARVKCVCTGQSDEEGCASQEGKTWANQQGPKPSSYLRSDDGILSFSEIEVKVTLKSHTHAWERDPKLNTSQDHPPGMSEYCNEML